MKIHYIQHAPFESLGVIEDWIRENNFQVQGTHTYRLEKLPQEMDFDFLIILGGPQSTLELDQYPYLKDEINFIKKAIDQDKYVLGFCLGAQLMGQALGALPQHSPEREVGIFPVTLTKEGRDDIFLKEFPQTFNVIHWHNDMPGIPLAAKLLAYSPGCPHQAFSYGEKVYAFQFHLEPNKECIEAMIKNCPDDFRPGKYIQTPAEFLQQNFFEVNSKMFKFLDNLINLH